MAATLTLAHLGIVCLVALEALESPDWRIEVTTLNRLVQRACCPPSPQQIETLLPSIAPILPHLSYQGVRGRSLGVLPGQFHPRCVLRHPRRRKFHLQAPDATKAVKELEGSNFVAIIDGAPHF